MSFKASAPGSLMLLGEYAVLYGKSALVCAVDRRITVTLTPRSDQQIHIVSNLGNLTLALNQLKVTAPFQFVTAVLKKFRRQMTGGCDITITADFSDQIGLGSSAAVTTAMVAAVTRWLGGMVAFKTSPLQAERLLNNHALTAVYAGYKTPTVTAIQRVNDFFADNPRVFQRICQSISECAVQGISAARKGDWEALGKIMNMQQGLLEALNVNTPELMHAIARLRASPDIKGAKISGSGLGDCVVGLGVADVSFDNTRIQLIPLQMASQGVMCEKI
jgi:mevalonate kinase